MESEVIRHAEGSRFILVTIENEPAFHLNPIYAGASPLLHDFAHEIVRIRSVPTASATIATTASAVTIATTTTAIATTTTTTTTAT